MSSALRQGLLELDAAPPARTRAEVLNAMARECGEWLGRTEASDLPSVTGYVGDLLKGLRTLRGYLDSREPSATTVQKHLDAAAAYAEMAYTLLKHHRPAALFRLYRLNALAKELRQLAGTPMKLPSRAAEDGLKHPRIISAPQQRGFLINSRTVGDSKDGEEHTGF